MVDRTDGSDAIKSGFRGYEVEAIQIGRYHPLPNGEGDPTEVHIHVHLKPQGAAPPFVLRLRSRRAVDELIAGLAQERDRVFPT